MTDLPHTSDFVKLAQEHALLSDDDAARLSQLITQRRSPASDVALEEGLLDAIEVDIISTLQNAHAAVPGYEFLALLGRGGMGVVYRARQKNLDREVAIKTLLLHQLNHRDALSRFEREARTIGKLQHPNIVAAYDLGKHQGRLFLAMELVRGHDLGHHIQRNQRLDEQTAWAIARQIAAGLAFAQQAGIVHRDIKPANILVVRDSEGTAFAGNAPLVKISDFGLSLLAADNSQTRLTQTGKVVGTPNFMAPEQLNGDTIDCRADIYALGGTVYNMLAGAPPYAGMNLTQVLSYKVNNAPPDVREHAPHVSAASADLIMRMMAREPGQRIDDYRTLIAEIDRILAPSTAPASEPPPSTRKNTASRLPHVVPALSLAALLVLGVSGFLAWQRSNVAPAPYLVQGSWSEDLFRGASIEGWGFAPGTMLLPETDAEGGRVLALQGSATRAWHAEDIPNVRLLLGVALHQAKLVEIQFAPHQETGFADCLALRIEPEQLSLVNYRRGVADVAQQRKQAQPAGSQSYHSVQIERHDTHWWISFDGDRVGYLPATGERERSEFRLTAEGGQAFFEGIAVEELTVAEAGHAPPK